VNPENQMFENVKIEKDVPIPATRKRTDQKPWCDMEVGDSFWVAAAFEGRELTDLEQAKLRKALMHMGHKYFGAGGYSVLAQTNAQHQPGFRVWRRK
jgi:hypothetical protein